MVIRFIHIAKCCLSYVFSPLRKNILLLMKTWKTKFISCKPKRQHTLQTKRLVKSQVRWACMFLFLCTHGNNLRKVKLSQWYNISKLTQKSKCVIVSDIVVFFNKHSEIVSDKSTFKLDIDLVSLSEKLSITVTDLLLITEYDYSGCECVSCRYLATSSHQLTSQWPWKPWQYYRTGWITCTY